MTSSPTEWPYVSLIPLKWSMSIMIAGDRLSAAAAQAQLPDPATSFTAVGHRRTQRLGNVPLRQAVAQVGPGTAAFPVDVTDREALRQALGVARHRMGPATFWSPAPVSPTRAMRNS